MTELSAPNTHHNHRHLRGEWRDRVVPLLLLATGLRLLALWRNYEMPNPDGMVYILQAKALYLGQWDKLLAAYPWPTNLAPLLAGAHHLTGDWLLAGRLVSLSFSLAVIVPLYFLIRHYADTLTATGLTLIYVTSPVFVKLSKDIIRGPQFWFFFTLALWSMAHILDKRDSRPPAPGLYLLASGSLLLATWSRIEGILPMLLATGWLLGGKQRHGTLRLTAYFLPFVLALLLIIIPTGQPHPGKQPEATSLITILYLNLSQRWAAARNNYIWLNQALRTLQESPPAGIAPYFFKELRRHLGFLAFAIHLNMLWTLCWAPLFLAFWSYRVNSLMPTPKAEESTKTPSPLFLWLLLGSLPLLYIEVRLRWSASPRFAALTFFPLLLYAQPACRRLLQLSYRSATQTQPTRRNLLLLGLILTLLALPSVLHRSRIERSRIFKEFGLELAIRKKLWKPPLRLCGTSRKILYTHFFACLNEPSIDSPLEYCTITASSQLDPYHLLGQDCHLFLLSDRDGARRLFLERVRQYPDIRLTTIIDHKKIPLYGRVSLYSLSRAISSVNVN